MTPTEKSAAVDRIAKARLSSVVPKQDYRFGVLPRPPYPVKIKDETTEKYRQRITTWASTPNTYGLLVWNTDKLGSLPTEDEIQAEFESPTVPVPLELPAFKAKALISLQGLTSQVEAHLDSLEEPQRTIAKSAWTNNATFLRYGETVLAMQSRLGITDQQLDDMFRQAAAFKA